MTNVWEVISGQVTYQKKGCKWAGCLELGLHKIISRLEVSIEELFLKLQVFEKCNKNEDMLIERLARVKNSWWNHSTLSWCWMEKYLFP